MPDTGTSIFYDEIVYKSIRYTSFLYKIRKVWYNTPMPQKTIYDQIKRQNGEHFARAVRKLGLLDIEDLPYRLKYAGRNADELRSYLTSLKRLIIDETGPMLSPFQLLNAAGYNAYYANTLARQNAIAPFFEEDERLCTFDDKTRFQENYIINAVRQDIDTIKRSDTPDREDAYGRSVISIQISKMGGSVIITNRYNHRVDNPDNTFYGNPDNIIRGLSASLRRYFNVDFSSLNPTLPPHYVELKNQLIHYREHIYNTWFGQDFYVKYGEIVELNRDKEMMLDHFIFNFHDHTLTNPSDCLDSFERVFIEEIQDKKVQLARGLNGNKQLFADGVFICEIENGSLVKLNLPTTKRLPSDFLKYNETLRELNAPKVETIGSSVLSQNLDLAWISVPNVKSINADFLSKNRELKQFHAPKLQQTGFAFLFENEKLEVLNVPALQVMDDDSLQYNNNLRILNAQSLHEVGDGCFSNNTTLQDLYLPVLQSVGRHFFTSNQVLQKAVIPHTCIAHDRSLLSATFKRALARGRGQNDPVPDFTPPPEEPFHEIPIRRPKDPFRSR